MTDRILRVDIFQVRFTCEVFTKDRCVTQALDWAVQVARVPEGEGPTNKESQQMK